jgi:uncharacterized protein YndB with AHSA1/START domain
MAPTRAELTLRIERVLSGTRPVVFEAFRQPDRLRSWWGPAGFTVPSLHYQPAAGAEYRIEMQPPAGDSFTLSGEFRVVQPPVRLCYTFRWKNPDPDDVETLVDLSFADQGETTEVGVLQGSFRTQARLVLHRDGWTDSLDRLERFLAQGSARS